MRKDVEVCNCAWWIWTSPGSAIYKQIILLFVSLSAHTDRSTNASPWHLFHVCMCICKADGWALIRIHGQDLHLHSEHTHKQYLRWPWMKAQPLVYQKAGSKQNSAAFHRLVSANMCLCVHKLLHQHAPCSLCHLCVSGMKKLWSCYFLSYNNKSRACWYVDLIVARTIKCTDKALWMQACLLVAHTDALKKNEHKTTSEFCFSKFCTCYALLAHLIVAYGMLPWEWSVSDGTPTTPEAARTGLKHLYSSYQMPRKK